MKMSSRKEVIFLVLLFLFALSLRLVYLGQLRGSPFFDAPIVDAQYHDRWAQAIRHGIAFHEGPFFRAPLYAYFLAFVYALFGHSYLAARLAQFLIGSGSCLLIYWLGKRTFDPTVGKIAAVLAALYGAFIYFEGELLIPVLILFLDLALILAVLSAQEKPGWWRWLGCGVILGLSAIARPNVLLFGLVLLPWLAVGLRRRGLSLRRVLVHLLGVVLGTLLVISPMTLRNYMVSKELVPIASQGGVNFFIGNNPDSDGVTAILPGTRADFWGGYWDAVGLAQEAEGRPLKASEVSNYWFNKGLEFMRSEPGAALRLMLKKLALFWGGAEIANNKDIYLFSKRAPLLSLLIWRRIVFCPFGIVAPLALAGMVLAWRRREGKGGLLVLFVFSYMASIVLFFVTARFRLPVVPFLLPFAAYILVRLFREKRASRFVFPVILILGFGLLVNLNLAGYPPAPLADSHTSLGHAYLEKRMYHQAAEEFHKALSLEPEAAGLTPARMHSIAGLARVYGELGRIDQATQLLEKAISQWPYVGGLHFQMGHIYYARGRLDDAIVQWQETVRLEPGFHQAYLELGNAYEDKGQYGQAIAAFQQAIRVNPRYVIARYNLGLLYARLGRIFQAAEQYRGAIQVDPSFADAYASLAWLYAQEGIHLDEGIGLVQKALQLNKTKGTYWNTLAELYVKKGELDKARGVFRRMIEKEPQVPYWRMRLRELGG